jgi:hypothetical protein
MTQEELPLKENRVLEVFNMSEIEKQIDKDTKWIKFNPGDKKTLKINPQQEIKKIEREYEGKKSEGYELQVVDVNSGTPKLWTVSRTLLQQLNDYIKEEIYTLTISRQGTGRETRYMIRPVVEQQ